MKQKQSKLYALLSASGLLFAGCSTMHVTSMRDLNRMADNAVAKMVLEQPGLQAELGAAAGSIAFEWKDSGVPMVGKRGIGVLIDSASNERTPIRITKLEIDGAQGLGRYYGVLLLDDPKSCRLATTEGLSLENCGTLYIYVKGEPSAAYAVKRISLEPKTR